MNPLVECQRAILLSIPALSIRAQLTCSASAKARARARARDGYRATQNTNTDKQAQHTHKKWEYVRPFQLDLLAIRNIYDANKCYVCSSEQAIFVCCHGSCSRFGK